VYAQGTYQFLSQTRSASASVPDAYNQHVLKGLRTVHALVPDPYAQRTHLILTRRMSSARISSSIFSIIFKVPKTANNLKIAIDTNKWPQKLHEKKIVQTQKIPP
jgi:hypothetical protein